jgi:hypothetical protein
MIKLTSRFRFLVGSLLAALAALMVVGVLSAQRNRRAEERKLKDLDELSSRLNRFASDPEASEEQRFLHERVQELMERARAAEAGSYLFGRLEEAIDGFLDASDELRDARREPPNDDDDERDAQQRTARDLEQTYFRVRQGDYFARQSGDSQGNSYAQMAQRLYQQARAAYDVKQYRRARNLADAAREVIEGLENLAQAAVRIPEPPKL